ncbi:uncharacterized protein LOC126796867 [Argentina anserina]|uniref:uncharacterized protein LOC126796867 n=1 Tax=Argentina anserina TaxID=57926 RepID=UPI0021763AFD|nr:uncharacterized protein LOC126796867 [Potentilla anserina]
MASSSGRGNDPAWKYAYPIEGNRNGTICVFCSSTFQSGGITRLKGHLAGYDPHKSVKKCDKVPPEVKHEVTIWIKKKQLAKQEKTVVEEDIREELWNDYLGSQEIPYNDDDDDGHQYPEDVHPSEREGYREAIRRSTVDRHNSQFMRSASSRFPPKSESKGGSSSHRWQQGDRSKSYQYQFPDPPNRMPPKDTGPKQSMVKSFMTGMRDRVKKSTASFFIFAGVAAKKIEDPHFKMMMSDRAECGPGVKLPTAYEILDPCLNEAYEDMKRYVDGHRKTWETFGCTLMCDGWTGPTKLSIINFMVYSKGATVFLKSIVNDNASTFKKAGRELEKRYPLYWISCAAYCIDLIFEDIGKKQSVANVIKIAQSVTNYIYNHGWVLAEMWSIIHGDLVRPGKTRFATNHISIDSILKYKSKLQNIVYKQQMDRAFSKQNQRRQQGRKKNFRREFLGWYGNGT